MLVIKTGMDPEFDTVRKMLTDYGSPDDVEVLKGIWPAFRLNEEMPKECRAIISVGTCGGLCPGPKPARPLVGQTFVANSLVTTAGVFSPDPDWLSRLSVMPSVTPARWWSSGQFNTADDVKSRTSIFEQSGALLIDDESYDVAKFATLRNIPFAILRTVSDTCVPEDDIPPAARNALQAGGGFDVFSVIKSILEIHGQLHALEHMWTDFNVAIAKLRVVLDQVGPYLLSK